MRNKISNIISANNLDAIVYPTVACPSSPITIADGGFIEDSTYFCNLDAIAGDPYRAGYLADLTGFPDITVPAGFTDQGLPVGISFFNEAYSEPTLLGLS